MPLERLELPQIFKDIKEKSEKAKKKLPKALAIQKKKFLIAINKWDEDISEEDEEFVKNVMDDLYECAIFPKDNRSYPWNDSLADNSCLKENTQFELNYYLDCVRHVFLAYSGMTVDISVAAKYVLRHARQYGDTSKTVFQNDNTNESNQQKLNSVNSTAPLPNSKFINKIEQLIADLRNGYDETKFIILNTNATYITLIMLRRFVKKEEECVAAFQRIHTHDSYVKLCPWPLDNQLPTCNTSKLFDSTLKECAYLAVQAYLNTDDERTKRALKVTCVQYMEWNGLQLPSLFFKVVELYEIDAGELWDHLCIDKTNESLMRFANEYYEKHKTFKADPTKTQHWFPFCRIFNGYYHKNLSAPKNRVICLILAFLVDLEIGFDKSFVRFSHWVKSERVFKESCQKFAEDLRKHLKK